MSGAGERAAGRVEGWGALALPSRWRLLLGVLGVLGVALWRFAVLAPGSTLDDAFILLVYARHLVARGAFYYNPADGHLDGFTSPLDLLIKAAGLRLFPADPLQDIWLISLGFYLAVTLSVMWFAWRAAQQPRAGGIGGVRLVVLMGLLSASSQSLGTGSQFLLETPLYTLLGVWAGYYFLVEQPPQSGRSLGTFGLLLLALPLSRPEGLVVAGVCWLGFVITQRQQLSRFQLLLPGLILAIGMTAYYVWRIRYFGYWAPNSYYAKTSASRLNELRDGLLYVGRYLLSPALPAMAWLLVCPLFLPWLPPTAQRRYGALCALILASTGTVIYSGGDCYTGGRFLALPITLSQLALLQVLTQLPKRPSPKNQLLPIGGVRTDRGSGAEP